ncbi:MAG: PIN domain nuclease [wastewater metagenome]|nr:PIN domain nuclease [Candidatus Loosdrechtia aerotolerans]
MKTKEPVKVLIDTSVWIEFFRGQAPYQNIVLNLIDHNRVCCMGIVLAELIQGVKSKNELGVIKEFLYVFDFLTDSAEMWTKAGELSLALRQNGKTVGLADCYISVVSHANNVQLLTLDKHFEIIRKEINLNIYSIS